MSAAPDVSAGGTDGGKSVSKIKDIHFIDFISLKPKVFHDINYYPLLY